MGDDIGMWNIGAYHRGMMAGGPTRERQNSGSGSVDFSPCLTLGRYRAHAGHRRTAVDFPKADKASRGLVGWDGWKGDIPGCPIHRK